MDSSSVVSKVSFKDLFGMQQIKDRFNFKKIPKLTLEVFDKMNAFTLIVDCILGQSWQLISHKRSAVQSGATSFGNSHPFEQFDSFLFVLQLEICTNSGIYNVQLNWSFRLYVLTYKSSISSLAKTFHVCNNFPLLRYCYWYMKRYNMIAQ